jgi:hypothetical protein
MPDELPRLAVLGSVVLSSRRSIVESDGLGWCDERARMDLPKRDA